jgi:hypothetical protein
MTLGILYFLVGKCMILQLIDSSEVSDFNRDSRISPSIDPCSVPATPLISCQLNRIPRCSSISLLHSPEE